MDPHANLAEQERILTMRAGLRRYHGACGRCGHYGTSCRCHEAYQKGRLRHLREALREWMAGGGFAPDWTLAPRASRYYTRFDAGVR